MTSESLSGQFVPEFSEEYDFTASDCDSDVNYPVVLLEVDEMERD
jgi:hypothetical protein